MNPVCLLAFSPICPPSRTLSMRMLRTQEIRMCVKAIDDAGFSLAERMAIIHLLSEGNTHAESARRLGIKPDSSKKNLYRARLRARARGLDLPNKQRRKRETQTLAQFRRRAA